MILVLLAACGGGLETVASDGNTDAQGSFEHALEVGRNEFFLLTMTSAENAFFVDELWHDDELVFSIDDNWPRLVSGAFMAQAESTVLQWPVREADGPPAAGRWRVVGEVRTWGGSSWLPAPFAPIEFTEQIKRDKKLSRGQVKARVVHDGGLAPEEVEALQASVGAWEEIWAGHGLSLQTEFVTAELPDTLPRPSFGQDLYEGLSRDSGEDEIVVVLGEAIEGGSLGVAGSIPGSLVASPVSALLVAFRDHAGPNGVLDEDEVALLGTTIAHEAGHYTGLFHPVTFFDDELAWDALDDTPECQTYNECEAAAGGNVMFPYPVCDSAGCVLQDDLTDEQVGVMHRYTGTL